MASPNGNNNNTITDIANMKFPMPKLNCDPHSDPGLFVLSLGSTSKGLQLKDSNGNWIDPPREERYAVLWCGDTAVKASNGSLKPGMHRVLYDSAPRLVVWHELCCSGQVPAEVHRGGMTAATDVISNPVQFFLSEIATGIPMTKIKLPQQKVKEQKLKYYQQWKAGGALPSWLTDSFFKPMPSKLPQFLLQQSNQQI
eukprot:TRINITY_DN4838_c0_g2_i1.p1 TRINITY_DN4838_c0_g2~~TRINITY_DN4838_c0_g2_i1.p1  ORF type:complete len:227 (+),score=31.63 TRINITY_DN4838_c0_g2_i1:89-682(+)